MLTSLLISTTNACQQQLQPCYFIINALPLATKHISLPVVDESQSQPITNQERWEVETKKSKAPPIYEQLVEAKKESREAVPIIGVVWPQLLESTTSAISTSSQHCTSQHGLHDHKSFAILNHLTSTDCNGPRNPYCYCIPIVIVPTVSTINKA